MNKLSHTVATGLAMFSMFFGAGNVVFPLALGRETGSMSSWAILGLLITGIGVPFIGLLSMTLFNGCHKAFFGRIGKGAGFILALIIMGLIGPFGAIPRCITLSHSTIKLFTPEISLSAFSFISCLVILSLTYHRKNLIDILGFVLTPILLGSIILITGLGLWGSPEAPVSTLTVMQAFSSGIVEGYQTMDLLGALFFSSIIILCLKKSTPKDEELTIKQTIKLMVQASCIGATLLAIVYVGLSTVTAHFSDALAGVPKEELISQIAVLVVGEQAGLLASIAVALACLTTAIALATVFAEYIHEDLTNKKLGYRPSLLLTLGLAYFISTLEFSGIAKILVPILSICYPALITLSILNILYKLYKFEPVKIPVFVVFALSLLLQ